MDEIPPQLAMTRRQALVLFGCAGAGVATCRAGLLDSLLGPGVSPEAPGTVFAGGAPDDATWRLWNERGWAHEGMHYLHLDRNVQCKICPNNCLLKPGDRSHCRNKINRDGTLYTLAYANPCTFHIDLVEKKPLFHFVPGSKTFSLATAGCVFRCLNCQNWEISQKRPEETKDARGPALRLQAPLPEKLSAADMARLSLFPDDLPGVASAFGCPSVSYTYSEPTAYYEYTHDSCKAVRAAGLKNIIVTCGSIEERPLRDLLENADAAHIDLKGFDDDIYRKLNSGRLDPVLRTMKVYRDAGVWFEIINLIVPAYTDSPDMIRRMCGWIAENIGPDRPLHFSRFNPQYKLEHLPPTPLEILLQARQIARDAGLHYVYIGNVTGVENAGTTFCPGCKRAVVERDIFDVIANRLTDGRCPYCQTAIAGVWA